jgi:hypothetical protein
MIPISLRREKALRRIVVEISSAEENSISAATPIAARLAAFKILKI